MLGTAQALSLVMGWLQLAVAGAVYVGLRWAVAAVGQAGSVVARARSARRELRRDVQQLCERVGIMAALAKSGVAAHGLQPQAALA